MKDSKKFHRPYLFVGILSAAVLILLIAGFLLYRFVFHTPLARLTRGLTKMAKEWQDYDNPAAEEIGLVQVLSKDSGTVDLKLNVGLPQISGLPTIGLDFEDSYDYDAKNLQADFCFSIYNADLFRVRTTVMEDILYLEIPHVFTDPYSVTLSSLGKDYNSSAWADLIGIRMDEDYSYDFFAHSETGTDTDLAKLKEELNEVLLENLSEIWGGMRIEENGDTKKISRNGETVTCQAIVVTLDKDDLEELMEDVNDTVLKSDYVERFLAKIIESDDPLTGSYRFRKILTELLAEQIHLELKDDVQLCFYLDNKDRILAIQSYDTISFKNSIIDNIGFSFEFTGRERTLDHINGEILFELSGHEFGIEIEQESEIIKEIYEKTFLACLRVDGDAYMTLSGSLRLKPFEGSITAPKGAKDFFKLSQPEINRMIGELHAIVG